MERAGGHGADRGQNRGCSEHFNVQGAALNVNKAHFSL